MKNSNTIKEIVESMLKESLTETMLKESNKKLVHSGSIGSNRYNTDDRGSTQPSHWDRYNHVNDFIKKHAIKPTRYRHGPVETTGTTNLKVDGYEIKHRYVDNLDDYNRGSYSHTFSGSKEAIDHLKSKYKLGD